MKKIFNGKIKILSLKKIKNKRGEILKAFDKGNLNFSGIKEAYFSWVKNKNIKAWKFHKKMTLNIVVPYGKVKFVFYDKNKKNFFSVIIGENNYRRLIVTPKVWFGFKGLHHPKSLILNCANQMHKKNEIMRKKINQIKFNW